MSSFINFLSSFLSKEVIIVFISMIPIIELRGAIPIGTYFGFPLKKSLFLSYIGSIIPAFFIVFFIHYIFKLLSKINFLKNIIDKINKKTLDKSGKIEEYGYLGLLVFVSLPIPGTGVWSGSLLSYLLNMDKKKSLFMILLGNLIAGLIVTILSGGVKALIQ